MYSQSYLPLQLMKLACTEGRVQVLKLLASTVTEMNCMLLISHNMASLEQLLQPDPTPQQTTPPLQALMGVSRYLYYLDPALVMSVIARGTEEYPWATLTLLKEFCKQSSRDEHLVLSGAALTTIPALWVANSTLTHITLSNNLLISVPDTLFQLSTLQGLDLSHNCLEALPSVLKWNCPKLKELDVAHNRLLTRPYSILEGRRKENQRVDVNPPSRVKQRNVLSAMQSLLNLTGYNLYPCLCGISRVCISHNPALTQVSGCG